MRKEIPEPNDKLTIKVSKANDARVMQVRTLAQKRSGVRFSRAGVIDHLLSTMDVAQVAAEIAAKAGK